MSEKEKMLAGEWYDANFDESLDVERMKAKDLCFELNHIQPSDKEARLKIIGKLLNYEPKSIELLSPFQTDYGYNIFLGEDIFINHDCYFMDGGKIFIGDHVFIGPSCGLYTAVHPLEYKERNIGLEKALPIHIESNVWLGANVVVLPGVTIGEGSVIGAGSVVAKDIPSNVLAVGTPAKPIQDINNK
ncbi:sugar O-acetyltransferase [Staphylococcus edaphicus]|uniref:Acetyltransferase n=1 Tax=Staphylococcus edaphicus TaxID=1955013 RepID=A0A2C6WII5_9STAP|nr:sugar O-acetyltransferase [Staphylococcus edaphicus]PHK48910.1 maltose acetyltransferase [Staphylococcus edaphicus]UQW81862.1 sugar O-acetyltransferase [Staphylococcus edaphicus]